MSEITHTKKSAIIFLGLLFCLAIPAVYGEGITGVEVRYNGDASTPLENTGTATFSGLSFEVEENSVLLNGMEIAEKSKGQSYVSSNLMVTYSMGPGKVASTASVPSKYSSTGALMQSDLGDGKRWYYLKEVSKKGENVFEGKEKTTVSWEYPLVVNQDWKPAAFKNNLMEIPEGEDAHFIANGNLVLPGQFIIYSADDDNEEAKASITNPSTDCSSPNKRCSATLKTGDLDRGYYYVVYTWDSGSKTYISNSQGVKIGDPGDNGKEEVIFHDAQTGEEKKLLWTPKYAQSYGTWGNVNKEDISVYQWSDNPSGISIGTSTSEVKYDVEVRYNDDEGTPLENTGTATFSGLSFEVDTDWKTHTTLVFSNNKKINLTYEGDRILLKPSATGDWGDGIVLTNESDQRIIISKGNVSSAAKNKSVSQVATTPVETSKLNGTTPSVETNKPSEKIDGMIIDQMDFDLSGLKIMNSNLGRLTVPPITQGYLNMYTNIGWVIRNLYLDDGYVTTYFDLGNKKAVDVTALSVHVDVDEKPQPVFSDGPRVMLPVGNKIWNAEGIDIKPLDKVNVPAEEDVIVAGIPMMAAPGAPEAPAAGPTYVHSLPNVSNEEAATNQCVPMSVANSLQYLENSGNINVPNDHKQGLKGDDSLVGKLEEDMNRTAPARRNGTGVGFEDMLEGKFSYLKKNGLDGRLINKHQGRGYGSTAIPNGDFTAYGTTSKDDGNKVTFNWLCQQIKDGKDVEIIFSYENAAGIITGGHAVRVFECGETLGKPWIRYAHDRNQANDAEGLETPRQDVIDSDGDGTLNIFGNRSEIVFAVSESPVAPPVEEKGILGKVGDSLGKAWNWIASWF